jgi:uncharacterized membrane protein
MNTVYVFLKMVLVVVAGYTLLQVVPTLISEANTEKMLVGVVVGLGFVAFAYTTTVEMIGKLIFKFKRKLTDENV